MDGRAAKDLLDYPALLRGRIQVLGLVGSLDSDTTTVHPDGRVNPRFPEEPDRARWFALRVRAQHEKTAATLLGQKGYESFLPLYECRRRWSDRIKQLKVPLFPGYVFCRFDAERRLPILKTPGILYVVGPGKKPTPVDEEEIAAIHMITNSGLPTQPWPFCQIGDRVRIDHGPLCGLEGIVVNLKSQCRIVVSVSLLQRSVAAEVDSAWVSSIPPRLVHSRPRTKISLPPSCIAKKTISDRNETNSAFREDFWRGSARPLVR